MDNRAFVGDASEESEASTSKTPYRDYHTMSSSTPTGESATERLPINIRRPILYSQDMYPSLFPTERGNTSACVNLGQSGSSSSSSSSESSHCQSPTLAGKLSHRCHQLRSSYSALNCPSLSSCLSTFIPILGWLPSYNVRSDLLADLITGVTILALHIPQGLAYGRLAGVESINGLYVSLFPVLLYALFGGSRQISVGTFAVICIACAEVLDTLDAQGLVRDGQHFRVNSTATLADSSLMPATKIEILTSLCLLVGCIQFTLGFFRLGILATLLSDPIISAFVVACSLHVFTSQVFALFGVSSDIVPENELAIPFELVKNWYRLLRRLPKANLPTVIISGVTITCLILTKSFLEPFLMKKLKLKNITIPIDIIAIALLTSLSYLFDLNANYSVAIIPKLSTGFQGVPVVPRLDLWPRLFTSAILIAFIAYAATYTLSKIFARKHGYEVYPNQELLALGIANVASSFFLCFPASGSLARSAVQEKVGGRTQLASIISSFLIVIFLLFLSHLLDALPNCVLACIIVVALRSTMSQFTELFHYWRLSKLDGLVWICTFLLVVLCGVADGLLYGLVVGLVFLLLRLAVPQFTVKYHVPGSECYLEMRPSSSQSSRSSSVVVFDFAGPLIFLNAERFKTSFEGAILGPIRESSTKASIQTVVFDMSRVPYVDQKATECLLEIDSQLRQLKVALLLAGPSEQTLRTFQRCGLFDKFTLRRCFLTVHDAVVSASLEGGSQLKEQQ